MSLKTCTIRLLNKTYDIKCPAHELDNLQQAAKILNDQMLLNKRRFKHLDEPQVLLLAAINISNDLVICQKQQEQQRQQVAQLIGSLENRIHQVVSGPVELEMNQYQAQEESY